MVEPLATILFSSFLSGTTIPHHPTFHSVARNMVRHIRVPFPADFFTPHARYDKGKGKACELPDECDLCTRLHLSGTGERLCSRSLRCPDPKNLSVLKEVPPFRDPSARRHPSHHLPHIIQHRPPQSRVAIRALHASQSSRPSSIRDPPAVSICASERARNFILATNVAAKNLDPERAWAAYKSLVDCDAQASVTVADLLSFSDKMATSVEESYKENTDLDALHNWGHRLRDLLESLKSRVRPHSRFGDHLLYLLARASALAGDLQQATSVVRGVNAVLDEAGHSLRAYESIILSTWWHYDATHVLDFLIVEWDSIGAHLGWRSASWYPRPVAMQARSLRRTVYAILEGIVSPASLLAERQYLDRERIQKIGELLIDVLCLRRLPYDAHSVLKEMQRQKFPIRSTVRYHLVRALARADEFEIANRLFTEVNARFKSKDRLSTGLVLFAHQGDVVRAEDYFSQIAGDDGCVSADIAMLMHTHAVSGNVKRVVALFHEFFHQTPSDTPLTPSLMHYTEVIYAHAQSSDFDGMNVWLDAMSKAGFLPDIFVYSMVLRSFAMCGEVDSVGAILDQMHDAGVPPNRVTYTNVITLLAHRHDPLAAEAIYRRAVQEGVVPDRRMITSLMNAHVEAGSWQGVIRTFDYLKSTPTRHIRLSIEVYNTLLKAYVLIGAPFRVVARLFSKLQEVAVRPDAYTFALLIQSACDAGLMDVASDMFVEMDRLTTCWQANLHMNVYVLTIIMAGFLRTGDKIRAKAVYDDMRDRGIQPTAVTFGIIMKTYGNEKTKESFRIAEEFLKSLIDVEPSKRLWIQPTAGRESALESVFRPLMRAYTLQERSEDVERLFHSMLDAGGEPSLGVLTTLLDVYRRTGNIDAARQVWPQIYQLSLRFSKVDSLFNGGDATSHLEDKESDSSRHGMLRQANILCVPLSIYIDALSAAGYHLEIAAVWKKLQMAGFTFDSHNWNHLAVALVRAGEPERAFELMEKVILPYQRLSDETVMTRDDQPETPLTFNGNPLPSAPHSEALHRTSSRISAVESSTRRAGRSLDADEEHANDFAHPLHILHQISPSWNFWRPHAETLRVLLMVIKRLESGAIIPALQPGVDSESTEEDPKLRRANVKLAHDILGRIYNDYPSIVRVLQEHEIEERRRLRGPFGQMYNWA